MDGSKCASTKLLPSQIFNSFKTKLRTASELTYKRSTGVDLKVFVPSVFDTIKVIKSSEDYSTGVKSEIETLQFNSIEEITQFKSASRVLFIWSLYE